MDIEEARLRHYLSLLNDCVHPPRSEKVAEATLLMGTLAEQFDADHIDQLLWGLMYAEVTYWYMHWNLPQLFTVMGGFVNLPSLSGDLDQIVEPGRMHDLWEELRELVEDFACSAATVAASGQKDAFLRAWWLLGRVITRLPAGAGDEEQTARQRFQDVLTKGPLADLLVERTGREHFDPEQYRQLVELIAKWPHLCKQP